MAHKKIKHIRGTDRTMQRCNFNEIGLLAGWWMVLRLKQKRFCYGWFRIVKLVENCTEKNFFYLLKSRAACFSFFYLEGAGIKQNLLYEARFPGR